VRHEAKTGRRGRPAGGLGQSRAESAPHARSSACAHAVVSVDENLRSALRDTPPTLSRETGSGWTLAGEVSHRGPSPNRRRAGAQRGARRVGPPRRRFEAPSPRERVQRAGKSARAGRRGRGR
jgi:hypothetical protein